MEDYKYLTKNMTPSEMLKAIKALNGKWQMLTLLGWSVDDIADKPVIAIANTCSDICPGHVNLRQVADAVKSGIIPVTLGKRILRTETAGLVTAAIILYELG